MRSMLHIQCAVRGLLTVNGQFCGPVDGGGQTFPAAQDAEIFIEYTPLAQSAAPLALELVLAGGEIVRLEPAARGYALLWPDGVIQLELRPDAPGEPETGEAEQAAQSVLLRYLALRLAGDAAAEFERLPIVQDAALLRNILYSGIWTRFASAFRAKQEETP